MRRCSFIILTLDKNFPFCPIEMFSCAVFHNFAKQIVLIQYSGQSKHALPLYNKLLYRIDHIVCTQMLFYFSFYSFRKHGRARERAADLFFIARARGTLRKQRVCELATDRIIKRFHKENSIMLGLFSQNNMLLCGMQDNNSYSSHRTISVKIETFFGRRAKLCFVSCVGLFYFQHTSISFCPKILQRKETCCKAKKTTNALSRRAVHECTGFYMYLKQQTKQQQKTTTKKDNNNNKFY